MYINRDCREQDRTRIMNLDEIGEIKHSHSMCCSGSLPNKPITVHRDRHVRATALTLGMIVLNNKQTPLTNMCLHIAWSSFADLGNAN